LGVFVPTLIGTQSDGALLVALLNYVRVASDLENSDKPAS
jgi:hypothetical protein